MSEGNGKYATHFSVKKYFTSNEVVAVKGGGGDHTIKSQWLHSIVRFPISASGDVV